MAAAVRWTPEQLADYERRRSTPQAETPKPAIAHVHRESKLERRLDQQIEEAGLEIPRRNWFFVEGRDLELDRAWPKRRIAVEVQGMAHRIKGKFTRDIEKRALALLAGWRVLEVDGASIRDGRAISWLRNLLGGTNGEVR